MTASSKSACDWCSLCPVELVSRAVSHPHGFSAAVTGAYLALYTAYSKAESRLDLSLLLDFFLVRKGWSWTLAEANKAISLSGLTLMLTSFLTDEQSHPQHAEQLLTISTRMLWAHGVYSFYKFYSFNPCKLMADKPIKKLSVALGLAATGVITFADKTFAKTAFVASATALSIAHFWTMEVDYKYVLQVRPFAYLPFPMGLWAIVKQIITK